MSKRRPTAPSWAKPTIEVVCWALLAATAAHLWTPLRNPLGLAVQTTLSVSGWRAAQALEFLPGFQEVSDLLVIMRGTILAALLGWVVSRTRHRAAAIGHLAALVPLLGLQAIVVYAGGMAPTPFMVVLVFAIAWAARGPRARPGPRATALAIWAGSGAFLLLHALYVSGPGIQPALVADGGVGVWVQDLLAGVSIDSVQTGGTILAATAAVLFSVAFRRVGVPLLPVFANGPRAWLAPAGHAAFLALVVAVPAQLLGAWACPPPMEEAVRLDDRPGAFQLHVVDEGGALWIVDRESARTLRFALPDGEELPSIDWSRSHPDAWPEEQIPWPEEVVWAALVDPDLHDASRLVQLRASDGVATGRELVTDGCFVASWAPLDPRRLLLGCEYTPEFIVLDGMEGRVLERFEIPEAGSFEEVVLGQDGRAWTVPLWFGTRLVSVDLQRRAVGERVFLGDFNWGAEARGNRLYVTRFQEGRLQSVDMASGSVLDAVHVGYGARPVLVDPKGRWVIAAGTYSGSLLVASLESDGRFGSVRRRHVGGLVRSLAVDPEGDTLFYGGRCGVYALDLSRWAAS